MSCPACDRSPLALAFRRLPSWHIYRMNLFAVGEGPRPPSFEQATIYELHLLGRVARRALYRAITGSSTTRQPSALWTLPGRRLHLSRGVARSSRSRRLIVPENIALVH
jgi:hypothetical protein